MLLRWAIDRRVAVIPGATSKGHIVENLKLEGLHLTPEDLELIARDATALFGVSAQLPVGFGTGGGSPPLPVPPPPRPGKDWLTLRLRSWLRSSSCRLAPTPEYTLCTNDMATEMVRHRTN